MILAMKGIIPDKQYWHDPEIKDNIIMDIFIKI